MDAELLGGRLMQAVVVQAVGRAGSFIAEKIRGTPREVEFRDALRAAVRRLTERYPRLAEVSVDIDFFADSDVVDLLFSFLLPGRTVDRAAIVRTFEARYSADQLAAVPILEVFDQLQTYLEQELAARPSFVDLLTWRNTVEMLGLMRQAALRQPATSPTVEESLKELARLQRSVELGTARKYFEPHLTASDSGAQIEMRPRPGAGDFEATLTVAFPHDTEKGQALARAFDRMIQAGNKVTVPSEYVESFDLRVGGEQVFNGQDAVEITIGPSVPSALPSRLVLYRGRRPLTNLDLPTLRKVRGGTDEAIFETAPDAPVEVTGTIRKLPEGGAHSSFSYAIRPERIQDAREGWQILRFVLCGSQADSIAWERLDTGQRVVSTKVQAAVELSLRAREIAFHRSLAILQEATGVTVPFTEIASRGLIRRAVNSARAVRRGVLTPRLKVARLELRPGVDAEEFLRHAAGGRTVSLTLLKQSVRVRLGKTELDLGPVMTFMPTVRLRQEGDWILAEPVGEDPVVQAYLRWTDVPVTREDDAVVVGPAGQIPMALLTAPS